MHPAALLGYAAPPPASATPPRPPAPAPRRNRLAIAALVVGGLALAGAFIPIVDYGTWLLALVGLLLGIAALVRRGGGRALPLTATVVSGVALILSVVLALVYTIGFFSNALPSSGTAVAPTASGTATAEVISAQFGQVVTYDDGMRIAVSAPAPFTPSSSASGADQASELLFTVEIYNGTGADYQPAPYSALTSKGVDGTAVVDPGNGMAGAPPTAVIPAGQTVSFVMGYSVADPNSIDYDVAPGFEYTTARFSF